MLRCLADLLRSDCVALRLGSVQASAIAEMGAQVTQHNKLLLQLAQSFPGSHSGATVHTYDFGAAFSQARLPADSTP